MSRKLLSEDEERPVRHLRTAPTIAKMFVLIALVNAAIGLGEGDKAFAVMAAVFLVGAGVLFVSYRTLPAEVRGNAPKGH